MTNAHRSIEPRRALERWFAAAIAAVEPVAATRRALDTVDPPDGAPAVIAIGKASEGMAVAAVEWLASHHRVPAGGLVVSAHANVAAHPALTTMISDHPQPGERSLAAAEALGDLIDHLPAQTPVEVFLSGGASALVAAPVDGVTAVELGLALAVFHRLGLDIRTMNALRRQLTRWSGGRLATALGGRPVRAWVISDVIDNDMTIIGSGPLVGGGVDIVNIFRILEQPRLAAELPISVQRALTAPPPKRVRPITHRIVADGRVAGDAAAVAARGDGVVATLHRSVLQGDATAAAQLVVSRVDSEITRHETKGDPNLLVYPSPRIPELHIWTGETTVVLPENHGTGGRAQQFALAAAIEFAGNKGHRTSAAEVTLLAAGTDGRDGPTDAAGAIVDRGTCNVIRKNGDDPVDALARADAYPVLDRAGALLRTGPTGTNVADVVLALIHERR